MAGVAVGGDAVERGDGAAVLGVTVVAVEEEGGAVGLTGVALDDEVADARGVEAVAVVVGDQVLDQATVPPTMSRPSLSPAWSS